MITDTQLRLQTAVSGRLTQLGFNLEDIRFQPAAADGSIEAVVLGKRPDDRGCGWATWATHIRPGEAPEFGGVYWGHYDLNADEGRVDFTRR